MCGYIIYFLCLNIFVFCTCKGQLKTILNNGQLVGRENVKQQFVQLLKLISIEFQYDYIVFVKDVAVKEKGCSIIEDSVYHAAKPFMTITNLGEQLKHSRNTLLLTCSFEYLEKFYISNTLLQYVPHVIYLETAEVEIEAAVEKFCNKIHASGYFQNLIITKPSLNGASNYLTCDLEKHVKATSPQLFIKTFYNMHGLSITTESDQLPPRSILFYDDFGQLKLIGFVANYLTTFAQRYNATLIIVPPRDLGVTVHYDYLVNKTFQGILDIAALVTPYKVDSAFESYSYPVELTAYCYMIPLPHIRPAYNVYFDIIEARSMLIIFIYFLIFSMLLNVGQNGENINEIKVSKMVLNDKSIRGLLGQSFVMPRTSSLLMKYILFLLCFSSILLSTSYQAYLQSHLVHPSLEKRMETYEDIRSNNLKILIDEREMNFIYRETLESYSDLFVKEFNFYRFLKLRDSMDTRYIFPVSQTRWTVFHERQKLFQRKLFYYSSHLCLNNLLLLSFPLRPGLPYKLLFNQHLLDIRDTGLLDCWLKHNFLNMVRLKLSSFNDLSVADKYGEKLALSDLLWIWILYAASISLSFLVFMGELLLNKIKCLKKF